MTIMKRLKFNEGGQPVFLDDLKVLQENDDNSVRTLFRALGNGENAFLLKKPEVADVSASEDDYTTTFTLKSGVIVVDGEPLSWPDTELTIPDWETPIYLVVNREDSDSRVFEDGQSKACVTDITVTPKLDNSGAAEWYALYSLRKLEDLVKDFIGIKENSWKNIPVTFYNGYSGDVKYQDLDFCRRVYINISSKNSSPLSGDVLLFYCDESFLHNFDSPVSTSVVTENGILSFTIGGFEGMVRASVSLPADDIDSASLLPVKTIFELPK